MAELEFNLVKQLPSTVKEGAVYMCASDSSAFIKVGKSGNIVETVFDKKALMKIIEDNELVTAKALVDLDSRIKIVDSSLESINDEIFRIDSSLNSFALASDLEEVELVTASALIDLDNKIKNTDSSSGEALKKITSQLNKFALATDLIEVETVTARSLTDLDTRINAATAELDSKQPTLVSGSNIKTINGESILGSGNVEIESGSEAMTAVTYSELKTLRDNSQLVPGMQYRITDYHTTTAQENTTSADHQFDIIVTADSESVLNENARAIQHGGETVWKVDVLGDVIFRRYPEGDKVYAEVQYYAFDSLVEGVHIRAYSIYENPNTGDTLYIDDEDIIRPADDGSWVKTPTDYFADCNLAAWELKYCLDNDVYRFAWALSHGDGYLCYGDVYSDAGKDVTIDGESYHIYEMTIYPLEEEDSWVLGKKGDTFYWVYNEGGEILLDEEIPSSDIQWVEAASGNGVIYYMKDEFNNECPYDFKNIMFERWWNPDTSLWSNNNGDEEGLFVYTFNSEVDSEATEVEDISISRSSGVHSNRTARYIHDNVVTLNNNVFFGSNCANNTLGINCHHNTFGSNCVANTFRGGSMSLEVNKDCADNILENWCCSNTFGSGAQSNTLEDNCYENQFGDACLFSHLGGSCSHIILGNGSIINCGNECYGITLGNGCSLYCGNECYGITLGNGCFYVLFGTSSSTGFDVIDYCRFITIDDGSQYCYISGTTTPTSSNYLQNIRVERGLQGEPMLPYRITVAPGLEYETKVAKNSSGTLKIYCEADLIN